MCTCDFIKRNFHLKIMLASRNSLFKETESYMELDQTMFIQRKIPGGQESCEHKIKTYHLKEKYHKYDFPLLLLLLSKSLLNSLLASAKRLEKFFLDARILLGVRKK